MGLRAKSPLNRGLRRGTKSWKKLSVSDSQLCICMQFWSCFKISYIFGQGGGHAPIQKEGGRPLNSPVPKTHAFGCPRSSHTGTCRACGRTVNISSGTASDYGDRCVLITSANKFSWLFTRARHSNQFLTAISPRCRDLADGGLRNAWTPIHRNLT